MPERLPSSLPSPEGPKTNQESLAFSPNFSAAQHRPSLKANEQATYDVWLEEVRNVFARIGAKDETDFHRILTEHPKTLTMEELEKINTLMNRLYFAWRHGRLPPEDPKQSGEILEDSGIPFDTSRYFLIEVVGHNGRPYFIVQDEQVGAWFVMNERGEKGRSFSSINEVQVIGESLCYEGLKSGGLFTLVVNGKEVSHFETRKLFNDKRLPVFLDIQGKPAWLEFEQGKIFISLDGMHIGDSEGYDDIKEFASYEGKLLFQARKGKRWHTIFDGKETHPSTHKEEMYQHFGMSNGQLLYTKTEETNWLVTKTNKVQVYKGDSVLHALKNIEGVAIFDIGQGHVATTARYPARPEGLFQASPSGMHTWIDGQHVGNEQGYTHVQKIRRIGHALACLVQYRDKTGNLSKPIFCLDGVVFPQLGTIHKFLELNGDIIFVTSDPIRGYVTIYRGLRREVLWSDNQQKNHQYFPKIDAVFGKLWARVFVKDRWCVLFDGKKIPLDKKADEIGSPMIIGSHVLFFIHADGNYHLFDEDGFSHGAFPQVPLVEPIDEDRCYVYGQEGRDTNAKLVRRVIEL